MIKVLLVEDNKKINDNIRLYLKGDFEIQPVFSGEDALLYLDTYTYDLVILDLMLPGIDGMSVLSYIEKNHKSIGVLMLTAKEDLGDKLRAFELGAQDHIFDRFYRSGEVRASGIEGSGIGLSLLQSLAYTMGIKIKVHSIYSEGSTFILEVPLKMSK